MTSNCPSVNLCGKENIVRDGRYYRRSESRWIQRFRCRSCGTRFSHATGTLEFGQRKRRVNPQLRRLLCSGVSMRRCARILGINKNTVERKLIYLAKKAQRSHEHFLKERRGQVTHLQFDDLITSEHTKMKPLTVSLAVDAKTRAILGAKVERITAFGHLAELSRRKYGRRQSFHQRGLERLFKQISATVAPAALIESDEHNRYPVVVRRFLPGRSYRQYPGGRGAVVGQGELKKLRHDPLFILNHSCAMLRANINRLIRKTWCTTKCPLRLQRHLDLYVEFHNREYLAL